MRKFRFLTIALIFSSSAAMAFEMPPTVVETAVAATDSWQPSVQTTGILVAKQGITVSSEVAGRINQINFTSGNLVKKGQVLATLNADILKAQLALGEAKLKLSKQQYQRNADLLVKKATSQANVDDALAQLKVNEAGVQQTQAQLEQMTIKAPFEGRLGLRQIDLGDFVSPGSAIVNLQTIDPILIDFDLPVVYLGKLAKGQTVMLSSQTYPDQTFKATVIAYESKINPQSQSLKVRAQMDNPKGQLIPGSYMHAKLMVDTSHQFIMVPQSAVLYSSDGPYLYRFKDGKAEKVSIKVSHQTHQKIIITSGIQAGDTIITAGGMKLFNGAPVIDSNAAKPPKQG